MATQDVGNGIQLVDFAKSAGSDSALDQYSKVLSLTDLANRIAMAPAQREAQAMENQLKKAQVDLIPLTQQRAQFDLEAAQAGERRAQQTAYFAHIDDVGKAFNHDFAQGEYALANFIPGAKAKQLPDKSVSIVAPLPTGGTKTFRIFPTASAADPKDVAQNEQQLRQQWLNKSKPFAEMDQTYRSMAKYAANPSGPGDLALIIGYAKVLDPNSVVRSEEGEAIQATSSLPAWVVTKYEQLKSGAKLDDPTRKAILENANRRIAPVREDLINEARTMGESWRTLGYDPRRIYVPVGSLDAFKEVTDGAARRAPTPAEDSPAKGERSAGARTAPDYKSETPSAARSVRTKAETTPPPNSATAAAPAESAQAVEPVRVQDLTSQFLQKKQQKKPGAL